MFSSIINIIILLGNINDDHIAWLNLINFEL